MKLHRLPLYLAVGIAALVVTGCRSNPTPDPDAYWCSQHPECVASHGRPVLTLAYFEGYPKPDAPPLSQSHPKMVVRASMFSDGLVRCETADGSVVEHQMSATDADRTTREIYAQASAAPPVGTCVDCSFLMLTVRGERMLEAEWPPAWNDPRVATQRGWRRTIAALGCPVGPE